MTYNQILVTDIVYQNCIMFKKINQSENIWAKKDCRYPFYLKRYDSSVVKSTLLSSMLQAQIS